jgi:hypothetical protein
MIADQLKTQFEIVLDKRKIHLEHPIKSLGEHDIELRLHPEVTATLKVRVESTTPLAAPVEGKPARQDGKEHADGKEGAAKTESRGHKRADKAREEKAGAEAETAEKPARAERKPRSEKGGKPAKSERAEKGE